uniref:(northern house mosquito) hypothetical protein n=1 Tax=Culex pipiens TaxID=7175 RepID=A0A8D8F695_CULPI
MTAMNMTTTRMSTSDVPAHGKCPNVPSHRKSPAASTNSVADPRRRITFAKPRASRSAGTVPLLLQQKPQQARSVPFIGPNQQQVHPSVRTLRMDRFRAKVVQVYEPISDGTCRVVLS